MESTFTNVNAFQPNSLVAPQTSRNMSTNTQLQMEINIPTIMAALTATAAGVLYISGAGDRDKQRQYAEYEAETKQREAERARQAYIEPRNFWREEELRDYDGSKDPDGPILIAADGRVWNVYKGRNFYLPGSEYHLFAGRDATRLLAKGKLEEETEDERAKPLNMAERAALQGWMWTFQTKYEVVGEIDGFDPKSTSTRAIK